MSSTMRLFLLATSLLACARPLLAQTCSPTRVTHSWNGLPLDDNSTIPSISGDGRYVAFQSDAHNLVNPHSLPIKDVFVCDTWTGVITCESVDANGALGTNHSFEPALSFDGHWLVYNSFSSNLVSGDTAGNSDIFLRDRTNGFVRRVSLGMGGAEANSQSTKAEISGDGNYILFESLASNLVPGDTNNALDIFLYDVAADTTTLVSISTPGSPSASGGGRDSTISGDGRFVAFGTNQTIAPNDTNSVWDVVVWDRVLGTYELATVDSNGAQAANNDAHAPSLSYDGRFVVYTSAAATLVAGDTNSQEDVFLRDRQLGITERINVPTLGVQSTSGGSSPHVSGDGRFVTFAASATDLAQWETSTQLSRIYLRDRVRGSTTLVSYSTLGAANGPSYYSAITADGSRIAFDSQAQNLTPTDNSVYWDIFVLDCPELTADAFCTGMSSLCPCANGGRPQHGCANSFDATGGALSAAGTASVSADTVVLSVTNLPPAASALYYQGTTVNIGGVGFAYGDGLSCVGGTVVRLGTKISAGGASSYGFGIGSDPLVSVRGAIPPAGTTRYYQAWYRNNATYCTAQSFNLTNGVRIVWTP